MRNIEPIGEYQDVISVPPPADSSNTLRREDYVRMGVPLAVFDRLRQYGLATAVAQYYGIVQEGLHFADTVHLFRGLQRPLMDEEDEDGDKRMFVYSWVPRNDYEWDWSSQMPRPRTPPAHLVFVVLAKPYDSPDEHGVHGVVLHWGWIAEDPWLPSAPIESRERFTERVWTKHKLRL